MLTKEQHEQLLKPLNESRVAKRQQSGRALSYLEAWDVKAHLIRVFGFLGWSADVIESTLVFEEKNEKGNWDVAYKVTLRLRIHSDNELLFGDVTYTEAAVGSSSLPRRGDAHDMAIKTAESDALKRAAINLGTQFGLSLYNNGSLQDVVVRTLVEPKEGK
jgi:recombination DNA repair RAD52 pathway protein